MKAEGRKEKQTNWRQKCSVTTALHQPHGVEDAEFRRSSNCSSELECPDPHFSKTPGLIMYATSAKKQEVRAEVRGRGDKTEEESREERYGRGDPQGRREHKDVLAGSVDFSARRKKRWGVNVKPDRSRNVTLLPGRREVCSL